MRPLDRQAGDGIGAHVGERQILGACGGRSPEHRVHQARGARSPPPCQTHAGVDRGVGGHPVEEEELEEAQAKRHQHRRVERLPSRVQQLLQVMVEPPLPGEGAVDQAGDEGSVLLAERAGRQAVREQDVGKRVGALDSQQDLVRQRPGVGRPP